MNLKAEKTIMDIPSYNDDSVTNSDETFYSPESTIPSNLTVSPEKSITPNERLSHVQNDHDQIHVNDPLPRRYNEIAFIRKINSYDKTPKDKPIYVISSVRPSFSCSRDQDHFLCHLCHSLQKRIKYKENEWKEIDNEYPFVRNIGSIWKHLYHNHCKIETEEKTQIHKDIKRYILSHYNKLGFKNPNGKLLQITNEHIHTKITINVMYQNSLEIKPNRNN